MSNPIYLTPSDVSSSESAIPISSESPAIGTAFGRIRIEFEAFEKALTEKFGNSNPKLGAKFAAEECGILMDYAADTYTDTNFLIVDVEKFDIANQKYNLIP